MLHFADALAILAALFQLLPTVDSTQATSVGGGMGVKNPDVKKGALESATKEATCCNVEASFWIRASTAIIGENLTRQRLQDRFCGNIMDDLAHQVSDEVTNFVVPQDRKATCWTLKGVTYTERRATGTGRRHIRN